MRYTDKAKLLYRKFAAAPVRTATAPDRVAFADQHAVAAVTAPAFIAFGGLKVLTWAAGGRCDRLSFVASVPETERSALVGAMHAAGPTSSVS